MTSASDFSSSLNYLLELRRRLLRCLIFLAVVLAALLPFSNALYRFLALPLVAQLPQGSPLIATALTATFFIPLKFTTIVALALGIPFFLYQAWGFVAPALYQRERVWTWALLITSSGLFYLGMLFAYTAVFPLIFKFFIQTAPKGVVVLPDIGQYLDLVSQLFFAFGLAFEVPVVIVVLVAMKITTLEQISKFRRFFIVLAFVIAMLLTPPDVVSQSSLAIPLCLLFEIGLLCARVIKAKSPEINNYVES